MLGDWADLARRAVLALERIADALEARAVPGIAQDPELEEVVHAR